MAKVDTSGAWLAKVPGVGTGERWDLSYLVRDSLLMVGADVDVGCIPPVDRDSLLMVSA